MSLRRLIDSHPLDLITPADAESIAKGILSRTTAPKALVKIRNVADARAQFTRNDLTHVQGSNSINVALTVTFPGGKEGTAMTTRLTPDGLAAMVATAERIAKAHHPSDPEGQVIRPPATFTDPPVYFESSITAGDAEGQGDLLRVAAARIEGAGLVGGGDLVVRVGAQAAMNSAGFSGYTRTTYGELSVTAQSASDARLGSGWGWSGREDFAHVDVNACVERAIEMAKRSENPVAIEPGRYTVILEPEAVAELVDPIIGTPTIFMNEDLSDRGYTAFSKKGGGNKIGDQMMDNRAMLVSDPMDTDVPYSPMAQDGNIMHATRWFEEGVLQRLAYNDWYATKHGLTPFVLEDPAIAKLSVAGDAQTLEEMIASTKRGVWVHRLSSVVTVNPWTLLLNGVTRDGTFLIENGKISRPLKNFRFSESPFFVFNKIDAFGPPVRASATLAVPRLKVHDFEFTSLTDAI